MSATLGLILDRISRRGKTLREATEEATPPRSWLVIQAGLACWLALLGDHFLGLRMLWISLLGKPACPENMEEPAWHAYFSWQVQRAELARLATLYAAK